MASSVRCPACKAKVVVHNPKYMVVVKCHSCAQEFLAASAEPIEEIEIKPELVEPVLLPDAESDWRESYEQKAPYTSPEESRGEPAVVVFCPMCGELSPEWVPTCPACGEELFHDEHPDDWVYQSPAHSHKFYALARVLGLLWIVLAVLVLPDDFWVGGGGLYMPGESAKESLGLPNFPLIASLLFGLGVFALMGQFWAIAAGGLLNYLVLFLMVWKESYSSLAVLGMAILLTHMTLNQSGTTRSR